MKIGDLIEQFKETPGGDVDLPVLTLTERNGFIPQAERFNKRLATEDTSAYKVVRRDDLAFNPYLLWAGAVAQNTICEAGIISPLYPTFRVRRGHDPRFVGRLLLTPELVAQYDSIAFGSVPRRRRSSVADFLGLPIPQVPNADEQQRIAAVLDAADALRAERRRALAKLDTLTQAIFIDMFGDPASNPRHLPVVELGDTADYVTDGEHVTPPRTASGVMLLSARNVRNGHLDLSTVDYVAPETYARLRRRCDPQSGDLLISCSGTIGRVAVLEGAGPLALVRSVALVRPSSRVESMYLASYLSTSALNRMMKRRANASSQANLFQNQIRRLPVVLPSVDEQRTFVARVAVVAARLSSQRESAERLDTLFASLQQRAFRGDL